MTSKCKTLLITGGSSGIGQATAKLFVDKGWQVFELSRSGKSENGIVHVDCDVTHQDQVRHAVASVLEQTNQIDVLISNAGFGISGSVEFTNSEDLHRQFDVNLFGSIYVVQAVLPVMRSQNFGRIIFVSSVAAIFPIPFQAFYSASKAAISSLSFALANEVKGFNISVCAFLPGDVATGFTSARNKSEAGANVYEHLKAAVAAMEKDEKNGLTSASMANKLYQIACKKCVRPYYVGGGKYRLLCFLNNVLPDSVVQFLLRKLYS